MSVVRKLIILFVVVSASAEVWGQAARSPFTAQGIGESYGNALAHNQGMGGVGVAQPQAWFLNNQNPALLVYNNLTVFSVGVVAEQRKLRGDTATSKVKNGNMNYLAFAFPVKFNKWTTSVGLMPSTNVDFNHYYYTDSGDGNGTQYKNTESGTGGLTQIYWSNGVRLTPDISVGLKAAYLFGPVDYTYTNELQKTNQVPYQVTVEQKTSMKGFNFGLGFSFSRDSVLNGKYRFSVGTVYTVGSSLHGKRDDSFFRITAAGDTLEKYSLGRTRGHIKIPANLTLGVALSKGANWSVATEFMYQNWNNFRSIDHDREELIASWRAALGGEFTPDPFAIGSYLKRITYRTGLSLEQYPWQAGDHTVKDIGINFGLSLPTGRSSIDLGAKVGKRGSKSENKLEESYFKLYFGITFNDQWFIKRRFD